jgi:prepilin peptidase CpaA
MAGRKAGLMLVAALLLAWLGICVWLDLKTRRLPNALTVAGLVAALLLQAFVPPGDGLLHPVRPGSVGVLRALLAAAGMLIVALILWRLKLFGAGDAKMLVAIAALVGTHGAAPVLLLTLCAGGVLALAVLVWHRTGGHAPAAGSGSFRLPYSVAIMSGTLGYVALLHGGLWVNS